jgi:hypothetical protein
MGFKTPGGSGLEIRIGDFYIIAIYRNSITSLTFLTNIEA